MITFDIAPLLTRLSNWQTKKVKFQQRYWNEFKGGSFNDELYQRVLIAKKKIK